MLLPHIHKLPTPQSLDNLIVELTLHRRSFLEDAAGLRGHGVWAGGRHGAGFEEGAGGFLEGVRMGEWLVTVQKGGMDVEDRDRRGKETWLEW